MAEFIGARISLISKRDIRYVGTLHSINSEDSTVALEQVVSYGTEGRRPEDEVPPALDNTYEYIVFRGSDVKDLRIEEGPKQTEPPNPPKVPDDPAILGSRKPTSNGPPSSGPTPSQPPPQGHQQQQSQQHHGPLMQGPPHNQHNQFPPHMQGPNYPYFPHPNQHPNQRFGPHGFPPQGPPGYPGMPYGAPPGWYPPYNNNNFPPMPPGQFPPHQMPIGPPGQGRGQMPPNQGPPGVPGQSFPGEKPMQKQEDKASVPVKQPSQTTTPIPLQEAPSAPPPPAESKPDVAAALAPASTSTPSDAKKSAPASSRSGRIVPAVPRAGATAKGTPSANGGPVDTSANIVAPNLTKSVEEANRDARAAVAAAMAKLPTAQNQAKQQDGGAMDNLTKKVNEMRTNDGARVARGGNTTGGRGRGSGRGGARKVEVPQTDYDFESANAKFNKQDLVKEAIATGSPSATPGADEAPNGGEPEAPTNGARKGSDTVVIPAGNSYNKSTSFFDDISSEMKDRTVAQDSGQRLGGREFRNEERQKNMETFGQGSVDNNFRYGRGRGRGRGRGFRGRGRGGRGRGGPVET